MTPYPKVVLRLLLHKNDLSYFSTRSIPRKMYRHRLSSTTSVESDRLRKDERDLFLTISILDDSGVCPVQLKHVLAGPVIGPFGHVSITTPGWVGVVCKVEPDQWVIHQRYGEALMGMTYQ